MKLDTPNDDASPEVEKLAALLSRIYEGDSYKEAHDQYLDEIERLFKDYPNHATLIIDTFISNRESESELYFTIAIALVDYLSKRDPIVALKYAANSKFSGAVNMGAAVTALIEQGNTETLTEALPLVSKDYRPQMISSIGALLDPQQLLGHKDWINEISIEARESLMAGYKPEHYPRFEEFDEWPLKNLLVDAIRPRLARSLALRMENINNAEDSQGMLDQFENLPGYTETDREVMEQEWYDRYLQNDPENREWAVLLMHDPDGTIAARAASEIYEEQSGEAAFDLIQQLSDKRKNRAMRGFMFTWYQYDSMSLSEHLVTLPAGETRRLAAQLLARLLERDDHLEDAEHWKRWAENEAPE